MVAEATCYPRPLQERIPILVGGSGERKTLRLVARHADACNLFGDAATVRHKLAVLRAHCDAEGRDPAAIAVTHLAPARVVAAGEPREGQGAATVEEHVGRYRELAEAGVQTAIVGLSDARGPAVRDPVRRRHRGVPRVRRLAAALVAVLFVAGCGSRRAAEAPDRDGRERAADGDDHPARRRRQAPRRAVPPRLGREPAALLPAVARAPRARRATP